MSRIGRRRQRFSLTRQGKGYVFVTFGVGIAAVNTGNNLLYLILGLLLSLLLVSGTLSDLALYQLQAHRRLPPRLYVGVAHSIEVRLVNTKRYLPSLSLDIREEVAREEVARGHPPNEEAAQEASRGHPSGTSSRGHPSAVGAFTGRGTYVVRVPARAHVTVSTSLTPLRRGVHSLGMLLVATRYPFGLIEKVSRRATAEQVLVFPAVREVAPPRLPTDARGMVDSSPRRGFGHDTLGLRPHRPSDESRDIHWRRSASQGRLVSRERAADADRTLTLLLDERPPSAAHARDKWEAAFEHAVSECASLAVASLAQGISVAIRCEHSASVRVDAGASADPLLRFLALLAPFAADPLASLDPPTTDRSQSRPEFAHRAPASSPRMRDGFTLRVAVDVSGVAPGPGRLPGSPPPSRPEHAA
ncbi:MAG: DUF58 domain-containing protein [Sandaracinaceae bacterium]|nr:DUF58 domain-containing protein [Sandaracinaceae bacterium]